MRDLHLLDWTLPTPAENLACDEALLDECDHRMGEAILRFWEPADHFVVIGYGERVAAAVHEEACQAEGVPILRRCSGGGAVLQGPGCLNYALVLPIDWDPRLQSITETNRLVLERHRLALSAELGAPVLACGSSDLALGTRKFSGNAQRRKRQALLFHGTFLLGLDLRRIERFLPVPTNQPAYRRQRPHRDFVTHLPLRAEAVRGALRRCWNAGEPAGALPLRAIERLMQTKYSQPGWNRRC